MGFLKRQPGLVQLIKYFFVGAAAALIDWLLYWVLVEYGAMNYLLAAVLTFTAATLVNYVLSLLWVFRRGRFNRYLEAGLVFAVSLIGLLFNEIFLYIFVDLLAWHHMIAKIAATGIVFFWNYLSRKKFIFAGPSGRSFRRGGAPEGRGAGSPSPAAGADHRDELRGVQEIEGQS